jgi:hypothetical protein
MSTIAVTQTSFEPTVPDNSIFSEPGALPAQAAELRS